MEKTQALPIPDAARWVGERLPQHLPIATLFLKPEELKGNGAGCIVQFEEVLDFLYGNFSILDVDYIWYAPMLHSPINQAIFYTHEQIRRYWDESRFGDITKASVVTGYRSRHSGNVIPLFVNPLLPDGVIVFAVKPENKMLQDFVVRP